MDDYELQKNELLRLLHTANSEERRQHIQNALDALDKVAENPSLLPAQASHIFHVPVETVTGANTRPYSARRRSSIKLHVIPEVSKSQLAAEAYACARWRSTSHPVACYLAGVGKVSHGHGDGRGRKQRGGQRRERKFARCQDHGYVVRPSVSTMLPVASNSAAVGVDRIGSTGAQPALRERVHRQKGKTQRRLWRGCCNGVSTVTCLRGNAVWANFAAQLELHCAGVQAVEVRSSPLHTPCPLRCEKAAQYVVSLGLVLNRL